jgi:hypothetical protein
MQRRLLLATLVAGTWLATAPVLAQSQQDFSLVNRTGYQINELYVSPSSQTRWGRDILGDEVMPSGTRRNITFGRTQRDCLYDIRIVYSDGESAEIREVDLCRVSVVTLRWNGGTRYSVD